jgi:hypothetical protein
VEELLGSALCLGNWTLAEKRTGSDLCQSSRRRVGASLKFVDVLGLYVRFYFGSAWRTESTPPFGGPSFTVVLMGLPS